VAKQLDGVPDEVNKMTHENAMRIFRYDPFTHRPRERAIRLSASGTKTSLPDIGARQRPATPARR